MFARQLDVHSRGGLVFVTYYHTYWRSPTAAERATWMGGAAVKAEVTAAAGGEDKMAAAEAAVATGEQEKRAAQAGKGVARPFLRSLPPSLSLGRKAKTPFCLI